MPTTPAARAALVLLCACALLGAVAPLASAAPPRHTTVSLAAPSAGDITYGVAQVRIAGRAGKPRGGNVFRSRIGGLSMTASASRWSSLRKTTKAYVIVGRVAGGASSLRNVYFIVARSRGGNAKGGTIRFTIANARAQVSSFWVRSVNRRGVADVYHSNNAITAALGNWTRYLSVLHLARAFAAAHRAIDTTGRFRAHAAAAAKTTLWTGGSKMTPRAKLMFRLIFGTAGDRTALQAAKRSPIAADYIANDLANPALAQRWSQVVGKLPLAVPDRYASAASEEARFSGSPAPRVARTYVVIADKRNAADTANDEAKGGDVTPPQYSLRVSMNGAGTGKVTSEPAGIDCGTRCSSGFTSGQEVQLTAAPAAGSLFSGWSVGSCAILSADGKTCTIKIDAPSDGMIANITATFSLPAPGTPAQPTTSVLNPEPQPSGSSNSGSTGGTTTPAAPFQAMTFFDALFHPVDLAVSDYNANGRYDVAAPEDASDSSTADLVEFFAGTSGGGLATPTSVSLGAGANPTAADNADFDGDNHQDVVVSEAGNNDVAILSGDGAIGFTVNHYATGSGPTDVAAADFDANGKPDVATVDSADNAVSILLNQSGASTGQMAAKASFPTGTGLTEPQTAAAGDLNDDGKPDLVVGNLGDSTVTALRNTSTAGTASAAGTASLDTPQTLLFTPSGRIPLDVEIDDLNGDGKPDVLVDNHGLNSVTVLLNQTASGASAFSFSTPVTYNVGTGPTSVVAGFFDADTRIDLATSNFRSDNVSVLLGTGSGIFGGTTSPLGAGIGPQSISAADLNTDAKDDLIVANYGPQSPDGPGKIGVALAK